MKQLAYLTILLLMALAALPALAADAPTAQATSAEMRSLLEQAKTNKKLVVSQQMQLSQDEANRFWPVYEDYQRDLEKINQHLDKLVQHYTRDYENRALTEDNLTQWLDELVTIGEDEVQLNQKYLPKLKKALPVRKVARYVQLEYKIRSQLKYDLANRIPLVP